MGFSRQEYMGFHALSRESSQISDYPNTLWQADSLPLSCQGSPWYPYMCSYVCVSISSLQIGSSIPFFSEKAMAPYSSTLAWKIPSMEEPGRLQSMGSLRVGHDWATSLSLFTFMHWRRKWQPTPVFLPGESQGQGSLGGLPSMGSRRVGHDWSDSGAAVEHWIGNDENALLYIGKKESWIHTDTKHFKFYLKRGRKSCIKKKIHHMTTHTVRIN